MVDKAVTRIGRRLGELLAVFLGVALAFLADDYREQLEDGRAEEAALSGLRADFVANVAQLSALSEAAE